MSEGVEHATQRASDEPDHSSHAVLSLSHSSDPRSRRRRRVVPGAGFEPASCPATGFKPAASTNFATRALVAGTVAARFDSTGIKTQQDVASATDMCNSPHALRSGPMDAQRRMSEEGGGAGRSRTDLLGFAIRCITALLPRRLLAHVHGSIKREAPGFPFSLYLERETSLELATSTLARLRSTN